LQISFERVLLLIDGVTCWLDSTVTSKTSVIKPDFVHFDIVDRDPLNPQSSCGFPP
jgi:hypothetical protein